MTPARKQLKTTLMLEVVLSRPDANDRIRLVPYTVIRR